ncbi:MAG: TfoX/Sxy family DNA transformation protein [Sedimentisphaerales bacterium]|nr:TfoX/Sxy family DNA transformation protein [Sedimentisphaerales bacterium]
MTGLSEKLESLPNIGKVIASKLRLIGIENRQAFLARDPYEIYAQLLAKVDPNLCRCALASLVGAKQGIKWHLITKETAAEFQKRYPNHEWTDAC